MIATPYAELTRARTNSYIYYTLENEIKRKVKLRNKGIGIYRMKCIPDFHYLLNTTEQSES